MSSFADQPRRRSVCSFDPDECYSRKPKRSRRSSSDEKEPSSAKPKKSAFGMIVHLCSVRDRSSQELRDRLQKEAYSPDDADAAIIRALECGLVDDDRFADSFIRTKVSAGKGRVWIQRELAKHGINVDSLPLWPDEYGLCDGDQAQCAISFLRSHPPRAKDAYGSAYRKLVQRGYSCQIATQAARAWMEETGEWR